MAVYYTYDDDGYYLDTIITTTVPKNASLLKPECLTSSNVWSKWNFSNKVWENETKPISRDILLQMRLPITVTSIRDKELIDILYYYYNKSFSTYKEILNKQVVLKGNYNVDNYTKDNKLNRIKSSLIQKIIDVWNFIFSNYYYYTSLEQRIEVKAYLNELERMVSTIENVPSNFPSYMYTLVTPEYITNPFSYFGF